MQEIIKKFVKPSYYRKMLSTEQIKQCEKLHKELDRDPTLQEIDKLLSNSYCKIDFMLIIGAIIILAVIFSLLQF